MPDTYALGSQIQGRLTRMDREYAICNDLTGIVGHAKSAARESEFLQGLFRTVLRKHMSNAPILEVIRIIEQEAKKVLEFTDSLRDALNRPE